MKEPQIHSHITDELPSDHPLVNEQVTCDHPACQELIHAFNNECMQTWVETGQGNFCIECFSRYATKVLSDGYGIPEPEKIIIRGYVTCNVCGENYNAEPEQCRICGEENEFGYHDVQAVL